jgi:hypothetical protein
MQKLFGGFGTACWLAWILISATTLPVHAAPWHVAAASSCQDDYDMLDWAGSAMDGWNAEYNLDAATLNALVLNGTPSTDPYYQQMVSNMNYDLDQYNYFADYYDAAHVDAMRNHCPRVY